MSRDLRLHVVTDERAGTARVTEVVASAVAGGAGVIQLRAKAASARALLEQALALSAVVAGRAALVLDDRLDVVLAARDAGATVDGVHLGQSDVPPATARRALGPEALIGWSAHSLEQVAAADALPAGTIDYLGVGAVRATATKPDHPPPLGIEGFADVAAAAALPCVAIGGVTAIDVPALLAAGAAGVAVVSAVSGADDPGAATRELARAVAGGLQGADR